MNCDHTVSFSRSRGTQLVSKAQTRRSKESVCAKGERTPDTLSYFRVLQVAVGSCWCAWVSAARRRGGGYKSQMHGIQRSAEARSASIDNKPFPTFSTDFQLGFCLKPHDGTADFPLFPLFPVSLGRENTRASDALVCGLSRVVSRVVSLWKYGGKSGKWWNSPSPCRGFADVAGWEIDTHFRKLPAQFPVGVVA